MQWDDVNIYRTRIPMGPNFLVAEVEQLDDKWEIKVRNEKGFWAYLENDATTLDDVEKVIMEYVENG